MIQDYIKCTIKPGAFSGEYNYTLTLSNGEIYSDVAPTHYFLGKAARKIFQPFESLEGLVRCKKTWDNGDGEFEVKVPSIQQDVNIAVDGSQLVGVPVK